MAGLAFGLSPLFILWTIISKGKIMTTGNSLINLGDLSQPVTVLIEKISNAIGVIYEPTKIRRNAKAEADANRTIVLADLDLQSEVANRGMQRLVTQQTRKQINIENIIQQTVEELPEDAQVDNLNEDWLANFFDRCENISNETMQAMWSRLLTSEATKPGTISKKTINLVYSMDKEDAEIFTVFCQFVWYYSNSKTESFPIIFNMDKNEFLKKEGIYYTHLMNLESIGLITLSAMESFSISNQPKNITLTYFNRLIQFELEKEQGNLFPVGACFLTQSGNELFAICQTKPNFQYLEHIVGHYKDKGIIVTDITDRL